MSSPSSTLAVQDRTLLLRVARESIESGLRDDCALTVEPSAYPQSVRPVRATFVTLEIGGRLRGCIGTLQARLPLVSDVAEHAHAAAFCDPRFPLLREDEVPHVEIHISVLSPSQALSFRCEDDLLAQLNPRVDGLVLRLGKRRATFLPTVWESLPDPYAFVAQLKLKAGLPLDFWSDALQFERYTTENFGDADLR